MIRTLAKRIFRRYVSSNPRYESPENIMANGSSNIFLTGTGKVGIFKGITQKSSVTGSKVAMNVGDTYGGLGDHSETGIGSIFRVLGAIFFIGAGKLYYNGSDTSASASTTLSLKRITGGTLGTTYQAGMAQPSAPTIRAITAPTGFSGKNNGVVSVKVARVRSATGGRSLASLVSNSVQAINQSVAVTLSLADVNGQDYWEIDVTKNGEGGLGNHFFLSEITESFVAQTVVANATTDADTTIGVPNGTLTSDNLGWQYTSTGDTTTYITAIGANDSHSAGKQQITLNAASVLTTTQSATFTRAVDGIIRTIVIEWKDADLIGADLAPTREYPPPAGVFGGVLQDVVFIDGCYGDTVNVVEGTDAQTGQPYSSSNVGNAIAISDPAKPEAFPPDNYLFTGDAPTCLIQGGQGVYWRFAKNSLGILRYVGGSPALSYDRIWTGIGVQKQHNAVLGQGGRLYAYTASRGAVRIGTSGEPDTIFASEVSDDMAGWNADNTVLGFDGNHQYVCYMNGTTIKGFYETQEAWCAPITLTGIGSKTIKSAVTINGAMYLALGDNSEIKLYDFNAGSGSVGKVKTAWITSQEVSDVLSRLLVQLRADNTANTVVIKYYINGNDTTAVRTQNITLTSTGYQSLPVLKPNIKSAKTYAIEIQMTSTGGDAGVEMLEIQGESSNITW